VECIPLTTPRHDPCTGFSFGTASYFFEFHDMPDLHAQHTAYARWTLFLLRIFAGGVLAQHGAQKLFGALGGVDGAGHAVTLGLTLPGIAAPIEFIGAMLIIFGLFTRPVAFLLSGEMAAAYFLRHFPHGFWPVRNHGEVPVMLCFVFLYLSAVGAGVFSLDYLHRRNRPGSVMG
jgi:putative oxidoreductase